MDIERANKFFPRAWKATVRDFYGRDRIWQGPAMRNAASYANKIIRGAIIVLVVAGCGGDGEFGKVQRGQLFDGPVEGIRYQAGGRVDFTDAEGGFFFREGYSVFFFVGDILIGEGKAKSIMTPIDLVPGASDVFEPAVINIVRFLLTIDDDAEPENGIQIGELVHLRAEQRSMDFEQSLTDFEDDGAVQIVTAELTAVTSAGPRSLISLETATRHFSRTLQNIGSPPVSRIFFTANMGIVEANADGTVLGTLVGSDDSNLSDIAVDTMDQKIYWIEASPGDTIKRASLDGADVETLVTAAGNARSIDLDLVGRKIYWRAVDGPWAIQRANFDGSIVEGIVPRVSTEEFFLGVAVDPGANKLYFSVQDLSSGATTIRRANIDGSEVEDLITAELMSVWDIEIDLTAGMMYWTDLLGRRIQRANLDGTSLEDLATLPGNPLKLALALGDGKVYWTVADLLNVAVQRANLDGTDVEDVVQATFESVGIALQ
ncbi:MAG: hypothetical protein ABFS23_01215 [Pseudomonadota bacterium]